MDQCDVKIELEVSDLYFILSTDFVFLLKHFAFSADYVHNTNDNGLIWYGSYMATARR